MEFQTKFNNILFVFYLLFEHDLCLTCLSNWIYYERQHPNRHCYQGNCVWIHKRPECG